MKKAITIILIIAIVAGAATGAAVYFLKNKPGTNKAEVTIGAKFAEVTDGYSLFEYLDHASIPTSLEHLFLLILLIQSSDFPFSSIFSII